MCPLGGRSLRRRRMLELDTEVLEVKLRDDCLMSSLFIAGERALANLATAAAPEGRLEVLVGGLGLGYTAAAALDHEGVDSLLVFTLWSDAAPDAVFLARMEQVFARAEAEVVAFDNPLWDVEETRTNCRR